MRRKHHHAPVTILSDLDCATFLLAAARPLLRIDASAPRALLIFSDPGERGRALRAAFARDQPMPARSLLRARRMLVRGVRLAQESTTKCVTGSELVRHLADEDAARRARWTAG